MKWVYGGKVYIETGNFHSVGPHLIHADGDFEGAHPGGYLLHRDRIKPLFSQYLDQIEEADSTILPIKSPIQ